MVEIWEPLSYCIFPPKGRHMERKLRKERLMNVRLILSTFPISGTEDCLLSVLLVFFFCSITQRYKIWVMSSPIDQK